MALPHDPPAALTGRGRATRERITAAAAELMHARGVARTSLDDVLAATGTSKSQLYHYFGDKSDLVRAVVARQAEAVLQAQQPELDAIDSFAALLRWRDKLVALQERHGCSRGCPLGSLATELAGSDELGRQALVAAFSAWQDRLRAGLATLRDRGELDGHANLDALALGLLTAAQGGLLLAHTTRSVRPLEVALDTALGQVRAHLTGGATAGGAPLGGSGPGGSGPGRSATGGGAGASC